MDADVIVVGGGIVGAACAHALAGRGVDVLVLDAGRAGATGAGMGHLVVMDDNEAELALSAHSVARWRALAPRLGPQCEYTACGTLWIAADEDELAEAERKRARLAAHGIEAQLLGAAELARAEPALRGGLAGALRVPGDAIVYAPQAARWLLSQAGVRVERAEVCDVDEGRVRLADGSRRRAARVLLANGLDAATLCPELRLRAKKGQLVITDRYPGLVRHQLVELGYVASAHRSEGSSVAFNVQPRPTGQLLIGSSREFDAPGREVDMDILQRMLRRALDYLPGLGDLVALRSWTGQRACSPDGLPLLGPHPQRRALWLALGHEGLGVTTATGSADLIAALMAGAPAPFDPTPYAPARLLEAA
jgi:glycine/D-amino acid oxidase-like deaminating enzyme